MNELTSLAQVLALRQRQDDRVGFHVTPDWLQGRTSFGGLIAVLGVQAMRDLAGADWPLRALQTNFIGPIDAGPVEVRVQVIRAGRNVRQVQASVMRDGDVSALLVGVFGAARVSSLDELRPRRPEVSLTPEDSAWRPFVPGVAPNFVQHLDMRWAEGDLPYGGGSAWHSRIHLRLVQPHGVDDELMTVMLADAAPTPAIGRVRQPTPASSVSWSLELRPQAGAHTDTDPQAWWRVDKDTHAAGGGYINESSKLWTPSGELAALGYQVVAVYA